MKLARRSLFRGVCGVLLGRAVGVERAAKVLTAADKAAILGLHGWAAVADRAQGVIGWPTWNTYLD